MAEQVVSLLAGARLDRVIEDTSTIYFRRRVYRRCPFLIAAINQSELSLIQGIVPKKGQVKFFCMTWFLYRTRVRSLAMLVTHSLTN